MKVVILCGGLGTRLKEETEFRPKPMVNIGNRPILWHIMKIYSVFGHKDFILNLGYKGDMIRDYFLNYKLINNDISFYLDSPERFNLYSCKEIEGLDWHITLAYTGEKTLKGARIKRIEKYIFADEEFMVTYGDGLADINIDDLIKFHHSHGKIATLTGVNLASRFGEMKIEGDIVKSFNEKPDSSSSFINGGFFVFNRKIFDYLSVDDMCDLEIGTFEKLVKDGQLMIYKHKGSWACMDTIRDTEYLNELWNNNKAFWKV